MAMLLSALLVSNLMMGMNARYVSFCKWKNDVTGHTLDLSLDANTTFIANGGEQVKIRYLYNVCNNEMFCRDDFVMAAYWQDVPDSNGAPDWVCEEILGYFNTTNEPYYYKLNNQDRWVFHYGTIENQNELTVEWRCNNQLNQSQLVQWTGNMIYLTFYIDSPNVCQ